MAADVILAGIIYILEMNLFLHCELTSCPCVSVKEKLTADPDSEIATTSLRVSLMCPVNEKSLCEDRQKHILTFTVGLSEPVFGKLREIRIRRDSREMSRPD